MLVLIHTQETFKESAISWVEGPFTNAQEVKAYVGKYYAEEIAKHADRDEASDFVYGDRWVLACEGLTITPDEKPDPHRQPRDRHCFRHTFVIFPLTKDHEEVDD